jgi:ribonuclease M5
LKDDLRTDSNNELNIQELIVVEGKNDAHAVRRALGEVDVIWTEGFGLTEEKVKLIAEMANRRGVIVCTDPDFAGKQIRKRIQSRVPKVRHVFLSRECALSKKGDDIGLENVSAEEIKKAFSKVLNEKSPEEERELFSGNKTAISMADILENGLSGQRDSAAKRKALGKVLGIGDTNAKQFLFRVNRYAISKEDFLKALETIEKEGW